MFGLLDRATKLTSPTKEKTGGKRELAADEVIEKGFSLPVLGSRLNRSTQHRH